MHKIIPSRFGHELPLYPTACIFVDEQCSHRETERAVINVQHPSHGYQIGMLQTFHLVAWVWEELRWTIHESQRLFIGRGGENMALRSPPYDRGYGIFMTSLPDTLGGLWFVHRVYIPLLYSIYITWVLGSVDLWGTDKKSTCLPCPSWPTTNSGLKESHGISIFVCFYGLLLDIDLYVHLYWFELFL